MGLNDNHAEKRWFNPRNLMDLERFLDQGMLYANMGGKWWLLRRNGATQRWKRDPLRFRLPVKAGLKSCHSITPRDDMVNYRVAGSREDAEGM